MKQKIDPNLLLVFGGFVFIYFAGRKVMQSFGLISDPTERQNLQKLENQNYFDPDWYKQFLSKGNPLILTESTSKQYSETIYNAMGIFNDNENAVYGVFEQLKTKSQVSWLAKKFFEKYDISLLEYLRTYFNDSEMAKVAAIINKLPDYKV